MTARSICILGGTGFVGRHLASLLCRDGCRVKILTRHRERHRDLLVLPGVSLEETDIHDAMALAEALRDQHAVVNLVGILNEKGHDGRGFYKAHVELARTLVNACHRAGVDRLVHMSALHADAANGPSFYLRTKGEGEDLVHASGLQVTSFQPSVIFGPGDSFFNRFARLLRLSPGAMPLACPTARFQPVYVGDVAQAIATSIFRHATFGMRYPLCGPRIYTLQQIVEYTARLQGVHRYVIPLGDRMSALQARLLEFAPGKPFTRDNYLSMKIDSVCAAPFPPVFGLDPKGIEEIVPGYITKAG